MNSPIRFYSTNLESPEVTFSQALLKGLAPDKGLYLPVHIPQVTTEEIEAFTHMPYFEIAYAIGKKFLAGQIPDEDLYRIVEDAYNYEVPLEPACERKYIMRLDQGPTASFKYYAARMM